MAANKPESSGQQGGDGHTFVHITYDEAKSVYGDCKQAAHGMLYARSKQVLWKTIDMKGCVLMHMRFDGKLGFPGGMAQPDEDPVLGLNREMEEEIGLEVSKYGFVAGDHLQSAVNVNKKMVLHFFAKEVTELQFKAIEKKAPESEDHGIEVLGLVRVPLFTMEDGVRGLPTFLANQFASNSRQQLLDGLQKTGLLTQNEIKTAVGVSHRLAGST